MRAWPMRGGWCRRMGARMGVVVMVLSLSGCPGQETRSGSPSKAGSPAATVAAAQPLLCGSETVLSEEPADTGSPVTVEQMQARIMTDPAAKPDGYRTQTVIVNEGLGSFRVSTPASFSPFWRHGTPSDDLLTMAEERDPAWTAYWKERIDSGEVQTRAISLDGDRSDELVAVLITIAEAPDESGDALAAAFADNYGGGGALLGESCGVRANGADGAYVEHTVPTSVVGGRVDRTQLQFLIPDRPNNALWGVTCDVPKGTASEVKDICRQIASTFEPLPPIGS